MSSRYPLRFIQGQQPNELKAFCSEQLLIEIDAEKLCEGLGHVRDVASASYDCGCFRLQLKPGVGQLYGVARNIKQDLERRLGCQFALDTTQLTRTAHHRAPAV